MDFGVVLFLTVLVTKTAFYTCILTFIFTPSAQRSHMEPQTLCWQTAVWFAPLFIFSNILLQCLN